MGSWAGIRQIMLSPRIQIALCRHPVSVDAISRSTSGSVPEGFPVAAELLDKQQVAQSPA